MTAQSRFETSSGGTITAAQAAALIAEAAGAFFDSSVSTRSDGRDDTGSVGRNEQPADDRWRSAVRAVVEVNGRIRLLGQRAADQGVDLDLPPRMELADRTIAEVLRWLDIADVQMQAAQTRLDQVVMAAEWDRIMVRLFGPTQIPANFGDHMTTLQAALQSRGVPRPSAAQVPARVNDDVDCALRRLDPDANGQELIQALHTAMRVVTQDDDVDANAYLLALRRLIERKIGSAAADRRLAARWLEALEQPLVAEALAAEPDEPGIRVSRRLRSVMEGSLELTDELRRQSRTALGWATRAMRQMVVRDLVAEALARLGYSVSQSFDHAVQPGFRLVRSDWTEHVVDVWLSADSILHASLLRLHGADDDEAALRERDRANTLLRDLEVAKQQVAERGMSLKTAQLHATQSAQVASHDRAAHLTADTTIHRARRISE